MNQTVDFTKGGYRADVVEETFRDFTVPYMPFWWHFREVLRASDRAASHWQQANGAVLPDNDQRELVALSLLNYAVYTGMAEALAFLEQMGFELARTTLPPWRLFEVRRFWKAMYSSLYTSFNALCNIVYVVVGQRPTVKQTAIGVWNYTPKDAVNIANAKGLKVLGDPLGRCRERLQIRDHLDHCWIIWHAVAQGRFVFDKNFKKGYPPVHPDTEVELKVNAHRLALRHIRESAKDFNLIYHELSVTGGGLDQYIAGKGWKIDHTGSPQGGQRPLP